MPQLQSWGLQNGRLEPWEWGNPGWLNERLSAHIISPVKDHLVAEALGWTPGTNGPVRAAAVQITLPVRPTKEELAAHLEGFTRNRSRDESCWSVRTQQVSVTFNDMPERYDDSEVLSDDRRGAGTCAAAAAAACRTRSHPRAGR